MQANFQVILNFSQKLLELAKIELKYSKVQNRPLINLKCMCMKQIRIDGHGDRSALLGIT